MTATIRRTLPQRRYCETFELRHGARRAAFTVTLGRYRNGDIGEVFVAGAKVGSETEAIARDAAVLLSIALQFHVPLDVMQKAITREMNGAPSSIIGAVLDKIAQGNGDYS